MSDRNLIPLVLAEDDKSPKAMHDKELNKAFKAITERKTNGTLDDEDIAFMKARRDYLTDEVLKNVTGMTHAEIEAALLPADEDLKKLTVPQLKERATSLGITLKGDEKKDDIIALIEAAE